MKEWINISTYDKFFYKIDTGDSYIIILESALSKKDLFLDIIELLNDYSEFISKIMIHKSLNENFESQIQITVSKSELELIVKKIKFLDYKEVGGVN